MEEELSWGRQSEIRRLKLASGTVYDLPRGSYGGVGYGVVDDNVDFDASRGILDVCEEGGRLCRYGHPQSLIW